MALRLRSRSGMERRPGRTFELSQAVSEVREEIHRDPEKALSFLIEQCGLDEAGAKQALVYIRAGAAMLGALPTQQRIVAERFFDEGGGMQLGYSRSFWLAHQPSLGTGTTQTLLPIVQLRAASRRHR